MNNLTKNFSNIVLENTIINFSQIKIQHQIKDSPRPVKFYHYCKSLPKKRIGSKLIGLSEGAVTMIGLDYQSVLKDPLTPLYISGTELIPSSIPIVHNYCGHQFGSWAGQLGDGRAHTLGCVKFNDHIYELQLKGSGKSPFSRHADGNSIINSALREYLASELMYYLGIPTSRALGLVLTNEDVVRDPFYNGNLKTSKAAVIMRIAESFLRFGSFQVCNPNAQCDSGNPMTNRQHLLGLADYLVSNFYKDLNSDQQDGDIYEKMFERIVIQSAELVASWQAIGFCHGVLNTDNMSMLSITIDYGPFAFVDYFSKDYISNQSDEYERYSFRRQPQVIKWNIERLAEALDFITPTSILNKIIKKHYDTIFQNKYYKMMSQKLNLSSDQPLKNKSIIDDLIQVMHLCGTHYTNAFRILSQNNQSNIEDLATLLAHQSCPKQIQIHNIRVEPQLLNISVQKIKEQDSGFNQYFITDQQQRITRLNQLIKQDCKEKFNYQHKIWMNWLKKYNQMQKKLNKKCIQYVLLNQIAQNIIKQLKQLPTENQIHLLNKILKVFENPYQKDQWFQANYWKYQPKQVKLTCSS